MKSEEKLCEKYENFLWSSIITNTSKRKNFLRAKGKSMRVRVRQNNNKRAFVESESEMERRLALTRANPWIKIC